MKRTILIPSLVMQLRGVPGSWQFIDEGGYGEYPLMRKVNPARVQLVSKNHQTLAQSSHTLDTHHCNDGVLTISYTECPCSDPKSHLQHNERTVAVGLKTPQESGSLLPGDTHTVQAGKQLHLLGD